MTTAKKTPKRKTKSEIKAQIKQLEQDKLRQLPAGLRAYCDAQINALLWVLDEGV